MVKHRKSKKKTIRKRREKKKKAEQMYNRYKIVLLNTSDPKERIEIEQHMKQLSKKFIRVTAQHIETVKRLLDAYGIKYMDASGEADGLCAALVIKKNSLCMF